MKRNQLGSPSHSFFIQLLKMHRWSIRHPKKMLTFFVLLFLISLGGLNNLKVLLSIDDLIDPDFTTYSALEKVNQFFGDKNQILLSIESDRPFSIDYICSIQQWILKVSETESQVIKISSSFGPTQARIEGSKLRFDRLLEVPCHDQSLDLQNVVQEGMEKLKGSVWNSILSTNDGYSLTINFSVKNAENPRFGSIDVKILERLKTHFEANLDSSNLNVFWGGVTTYQTFLKQAMDVTQGLNGLMFLISLLFFKFFFGSWKMGFIFNGTVLISLLITYGFMGYLKIPVDVLTNATGLILFASCLEDLVFVAYGMCIYGWSLKKSLRNFLVPAFFTSLTTAVGFASLLTSDLSVIQRVGVVVAFGGMLEWLFVFMFLPALIKIYPNWFLFSNLKLREVKIYTWSLLKPNYKFSLLLLLIVAMSMLGINQLKIKDTPEDFFAPNHEVNTTSRHFLKTRGWISDVSLVFSPNSTPQDQVDILNQVKNLPLIHTIEDRHSTVNYISQNAENLRSSIEIMWESSYFSERLYSRFGIDRAILYLNSMDNESVSELRRQLSSICGNLCEFSSTLISYNEFGDRVLGTLFESLFISLGLVALILLLIKGSLSWPVMITLLVASFWGPLALIAIFVVFKIPVFFVSSICASVLVGLAGDNAIQFIFSSRKSNINSSVNDLAYASWLITLGMILLFSVFLLSPVAPLGKLGYFMILGVILGYLGDVWLLKGLLKGTSGPGKVR